MYGRGWTNLEPGGAPKPALWRTSSRNTSCRRIQLVWVSGIFPSIPYTYTKTFGNQSLRTKILAYQREFVYSLWQEDGLCRLAQLSTGVYKRLSFYSEWLVRHYIRHRRRYSLWTKNIVNHKTVFIPDGGFLEDINRGFPGGRWSRLFYARKSTILDLDWVWRQVQWKW